jgi:hypothetical protein
LWSSSDGKSSFISLSSVENEEDTDDSDDVADDDDSSVVVVEEEDSRSGCPFRLIFRRTKPGCIVVEGPTNANADANDRAVVVVLEVSRPDV